MRTNTILQNIVPLTIAAIGLAACGPPSERESIFGDTSPANDSKIVEDLPPPTNNELSTATPINLKPGEPQELTTYDPARGSSRQALSSYSGQTWSSLATGGSHWATITLGQGENLDVRLVSRSGDADLYIYRSSLVMIGKSIRDGRYVDRVATPPYATGYEGTYSIRYHCYAGPCNFETHLAKGDESAFITGTATYVNQRSFIQRSYATTSKKCLIDGRWVADGECYCSDAAAAMQMANLGKIAIADARSVATNLFATTNNSDGAGNYEALMTRLETDYGYDCRKDSTSNLKAHVRAGRFTLFRSSAFSTWGHYVSVRGFRVSAGKTYVEVDDPYGAWRSKNYWDLNTTSEFSTKGQQQSYDLSAISSGSSLIVCY